MTESVLSRVTPRCLAHKPGVIPKVGAVDKIPPAPWSEHARCTLCPLLT